MKYFIMAALALGLAAPAAAAYEEEGLSEAMISTDTAKNGDEDETQPFVQESDEDLAEFVTDYIRRDTALKGAFLLEDPDGKKFLKLQLVSVEQKAQTTSESAKTVSALFRDAGGKKFTVVFYLQPGPWGGLDIFKLELKKPAAAKKAGH
ncbi:MAG: hypothetical protein WCK76_00950 [Elusimicrobiota bacterium]